MIRIRSHLHSLACSSAALLLVGIGAAPSLANAQSCIQVPVNCAVTSAFGPRFNPITKNFSSEFHRGIDFGCPIGTPIVAAEAGVVNVSGFSESAGNWVVTRSGGSSGAIFKYMHGDRLGKSVGAMVNKGEQVLLSGNTGRSSGPHLHFQMEAGGSAKDPMPRFCSKPPLRDGVLQGANAPTDVIDPGSQATAPTDADVPAMGFEGSVHEVIGDAIASRAMNPDYSRQLASLSDTRLYAEVAYMKAIRLKLKSERMKHRERIEATQAMVLMLRAESSLKPQLDAQRAAVNKSAASAK